MGKSYKKDAHYENEGVRKDKKNTHRTDRKQEKHLLREVLENNDKNEGLEEDNLH